MRDIVFPSIIDAIALDPGEHVFYAGGRDGKIYIGALNALAHSNSNFGPNIIGSLTEHRYSNIHAFAFYKFMNGKLCISFASH